MNVLSYLKFPVFVSRSSIEKPSIKEFLRLYGQCLLGMIVSVVIVFMLDQALVVNLFGFSIQKQLATNRLALKESEFLILALLVVAPIAEEATFRLPLRLSKMYLGIAVFLVTFYLVNGRLLPIDVTLATTYRDLGIASGIALICAWIIPRNTLELLKGKHFRYVFYLSAVAFALIHISNFRPLNSQVLFFYPVYTLPQLVIGLFAGYIRMSYGFIYGCLFHALVNLPAALIL